MENIDNIHILIIRLFSGESTNHEKGRIAEWMSESAENKKLFSDLREIWLASGIQHNADRYHLDEAISKFRQHIIMSGHKRMKGIKMADILKYAAIVLLALMLPISYYLGFRQPDYQSSTTISCAFGDKSNIILPDSTRVWLNSGSKLTFQTGFTQKERNVHLEGEAYFSVTKSKGKPFRVHTSAMDIQVLGTQFNVKAYQEDQLTTVTLVEGSLDVLVGNKDFRLKPGEKLMLNKGTGKSGMTVLSDFSPETGWKEGRLVFRNESLGELETLLERWFDVDIILADEQVKQRRFTGILEHESILEAISYFDLSNYVTCQIQGNRIIIKSEK